MNFDQENNEGRKRSVPSCSQSPSIPERLLERWLFRFSLFCVLCLGVAFSLLMSGAYTFRSLAHGCFLDDAMLVFVVCKGFPLAGLISLIANTPFFMTSFFWFFLLSLGAGNFEAIPYLALGLAMWLSVAYVLWYLQPKSWRAKKVPGTTD